MRLALVGDVMLGRLVNLVLTEVPPPYPWGDTLPVLYQADWRFCNLECVISDWGEPWSVMAKVFHFRSDAKNLAVLQAARIDAVSLANNHTLDFEYTAMMDMLSLLGRAGIEHAGAGVNLAEASRLAGTARQPDQGRIGLLAFTDNEPAWAANHTHPGVWYVPIDLTDERATHLLDTVRRASDAVDCLIVSAHWGPNWGYQPPPQHVEFGRALIDAGAHLVFGHSAHVVRGVEIYRDRLIAYSAGDFVDDYAVDESQRNDQSFVFVIEFEGGAIERLELYPTVIRDCQARLARGVEAEAIGAKMVKLCTRLGTTARWYEDRRCLEVLVRAREGVAAGHGVSATNAGGQR
jgi:poly-gamma-glutamate capsule biosynthesis protein CapA/YwtB (metallophosphatase superfamily)